MAKQRTKEKRNLYHFLLLREMFKWEVVLFYDDKTKLSMGRYLLESRPIEINEYAPKHRKENPKSIEDQKIISESSSSRTYLSEKIGDMSFSLEKLDQLARSISVLGKYDSWYDFLNESHSHEGIEFAKKLKGSYSSLSGKIKVDLKVLVATGLGRFVKRSQSLGILDEEYKIHSYMGGLRFRHATHARIATAEDKVAIANTLSHEKMPKELWHRWLVTDKQYKIIGTMDLIPAKIYFDNNMHEELIEELSDFNYATKHILSEAKKAVSLVVNNLNYRNEIDLKAIAQKIKEIVLTDDPYLPVCIILKGGDSLFPDMPLMATYSQSDFMQFLEYFDLARIK